MSILAQLDLSEAWLHEARNTRGEWTAGGHTYVLPDPERLVLPARKGPNYYPRPEDHPFFQAHPVSPRNIIAAYDAATAQEKAQGMRWYADAHALASAVADKYQGGNTTKVAGLLAAYSPQTAWPLNMFNAARVAAENRALGPGDGQITRDFQANAAEALDGVPIDQNMQSPKINSFAHLIDLGGDSPGDRLGEVVIDRHAMSVAAGQRLADDGPIGTTRYHEYVADQYRIAAQQINQRDHSGITPYQVQAITWLHQQALNNAAEQAALAAGTLPSTEARLIRGRQTRARTSAAQWGEFVRAHHIPVQPGTTSLTGRALAWQVIELISDQIGLAAWQHELRDAHGRWTRGGPAGTSYEDVNNALLQEWRKAPPLIDVQDALNRAGASWNADDHAETIRQLMIAAHAAEAGDYAPEGNRYRVMAANIRAADEKLAAQATPAHAFVARAAPLVPGLLGGGREAWNGELDVFLRDEMPGVAGQMRWDGQMDISDQVAGDLAIPVNGAGEITRPDYLTVPLHELIHGDISSGRYSDSQAAYQDLANASIEEGFTELGTIQHAADFFRQMGIGDKPTRMLAEIESGLIPDNPVWLSRKDRLADQLMQIRDELKAEQAGPHSWDVWQAAISKIDAAITDLNTGYDTEGTLEAVKVLKDMGTPANTARAHTLEAMVRQLKITPIARHATLAEMSQRLADPSRIDSGDSWGHYGWQTQAAQQWVQDIAKEEGFGDLRQGTPGYRRVVELTDEINRQGTAGKLSTMVTQVRRLSAPEGTVPAPPRLVEILREQWPVGPAESGHSPVHVVRQAAEQ